jgi:ATP-dependent DNA helicase RecQ
MYGGVFEHETKINTLSLAEKSSTSEPELISALEKLEKDGIISLHLAKTDAQVTFIQPREDDKTINRIASIIEQQNNLKQLQVKSVIDYVKNDDICKNVQLLSYFGEKNINPCGICSVCTKTAKTSKPQDLKNLKRCIIELLEHGDLSSRDMISKLDYSEKEIKNILQLMLEHNMISITKTNTYKLFHK